MERSEALKALAERVEHGPVNPYDIEPWEVALGYEVASPRFAMDLCESMDAALALHSDKLPGWRRCLREDEDGRWTCILTSPDYESITWEAGDRTATDVLHGRQVATRHDKPARALTLAILRALQHEEPAHRAPERTADEGGA